MKIEQAKKWVWLTGRNKLESEFCKDTREDGLYELEGYVITGKTEEPVFIAEDPIILIRGIQIFYEFWDSVSEYEQHKKLESICSAWRERWDKESYDMICNVLVKCKVEIDG